MTFSSKYYISISHIKDLQLATCSTLFLLHFHKTTNMSQRWRWLPINDSTHALDNEQQNVHKKADILECVYDLVEDMGDHIGGIKEDSLPAIQLKSVSYEHYSIIYIC